MSTATRFRASLITAALAGLSLMSAGADAPPKPEAVTDPSPGLVGRYFSEFHGFKQLAEGKGQPFLVRVDPAVEFAPVEGEFYDSKLSEDFGVVWNGAIRIDKPGQYTFDLASHDGSRFYVGKTLVVDNTAKYESMKDKTGEVSLTAPGEYPIRLEYHQGGGGKPGIYLKWQPPGGTMGPVPASAFVHAKGDENVKWDSADYELAKKDPVAFKKRHAKPYEKMDYGPFLGGTFALPEPSTEITAKDGKKVKEPNITDKGIIVSLDKDHTTNVLFDTETLRYSGGWTGGYIDFNGVAYNGAHGQVPKMKGKQIFGTPVGPGWEINGSFADTRKNGFGNIPGLHYRGLFRVGNVTTLSYEVQGVGILDRAYLEPQGEIERLLQFENNGPVLTTCLAICPPNLRGKLDNGAGSAPGADLSQGGERLSWDDSGRLLLTLKPRTKSELSVKLTLDRDGKLGASASFLQAPQEFPLSGPAIWGTPIETVGKLGSDAGPYAVDTITPPPNPTGDSWLRFSGFDFFPDGHSAAICTWNGDVWVVKGIDDTLQHLTWQRYATGLFQSLGLKIVNGEVYVLGRDQITRLHDLNGDGEADFYEDFNNDCQVSPGFHEFQHDLQVDSKGNFYYAKGGPVNPGGRGFEKLTDDAGCVMKVSPDGKHSEIYATGLRAPNGMSMGPHDELTVSDNQGTWTPACRISFVTKGAFLGVPSTSHMKPEPTNYGNPICWFPYVDGDYTQGDNSSGGAAWDTSDKWGPFNGKMFHLSYGTCSLFETMYENVDGIWQGGVCRFPLDFESGMMRARFNAVDGQLYLCGLKGWQTRAAKDGAFQRVRYTGKPVTMPDDLHVKNGAITIGFTTPVDASIAADTGNWSIEQWNTVWSDSYGSPDMSVVNPKKKGHDTVEIESITVSPDKKTVTLKIAGLRPVMQMKINMNIKTADGGPMKWEIDNTINKLPGGPSIAHKQP